MKYKSRYSPGKDVTIHNLIIEVVCENKARTENKELPTFFWKLKEWASYFKSQLRKCHQLSKTHGAEKLLSFVKKNNIYSLHAKWIDDALSKFDHKDVSEKQETIQVVKQEEIKLPQKKAKWLKGL